MHLSGVAETDTQVVTDGVVDALGAVELAGGGAAHHDMEFTHLGAVEHGIEGGHLVDPNLRHFQNLR